MSVVACDFGVSTGELTTCAEVALAPGATPPAGQPCADPSWFPWARGGAGRPVAACGRSGPHVECRLGDTALVTSFGALQGDALAPWVDDVRRSCHREGGSVHPALPTSRRPPVRLELPTLRAATLASPDCVAEPHGVVVCGGDARRAVTVAVSEADPGDPERVLAAARTSAARSGAVVTELGRAVAGDGTWSVRWAIAAPHGPAAWQHHEVRALGERRVRCEGLAWSLEELDEVVALCGSLTYSAPRVP